MAEDHFPDVQHADIGAVPGPASPGPSAPVPAPAPGGPSAPTPAPGPTSPVPLPQNPGQGLPDPKKVGTLTFFVDAAERAIATYLESLLGLLIVAEKIDLPHASAAAIAAVPAGLSILKSALAKFLGDKNSAALLPRRRKHT